MKNRVWITWEHQTRNISMANLFDCYYFELTSNKHRIFRYLELSFKTLKFLIKEKPAEVFFQNPSVVLATICALYKILNSRAVVVGDYHNAALELSNLSPLNSFISRKVDLTIVSNDSLINRVTEMKGRAFAMADPIPNIPNVGQKPFEIENVEYIVFICSWADDEPISTVLDAFISSKSFTDKQVYLYVTGKIKPSRLQHPIDYYMNEGVKFLGFVSEDTYWSLISHSICNIDLTTRSDCLVCGAYESIAVGNPVILSNNNATLAYFGKYCIYTDNTCADLKIRILDLVLNRDHYKSLSKNARDSFLQADQERRYALEHSISRTRLE
jgi:glycosyltransferase involved in cell wall biosynthesis